MYNEDERDAAEEAANALLLCDEDELAAWDEEEEDTYNVAEDGCRSHAIVGCRDPHCVRAAGGSAFASELAACETFYGDADMFGNDGTCEPMPAEDAGTVAYAIAATYVHERDGWEGMRQVPTFYLLPNVQGIRSEEDACRIARDILGSSDPAGTYNVSASRVIL